MKEESKQFYDSNALIQNLYTATIKYNAGMTQLLKNKLESPQEEGVKEQLVIAQSFLRAAGQLCAEPDKVIDHAFNWVRDYMEICNNTMQSIINETAVKQAKTNPDPRFSDEEWKTNPLFSFIQSSYLMNQNWVMGMLHKLNGMNSKDMHKVTFYTKQIIDAMSPSNFGFMNPAVIKATLSSNGENLVHGADNFLEDVARSGSTFSIASTDFDAFTVGGNLAITPGKVVLQNDLMQLIQYSPTTEKVHKTPLIIMPAWINKYYILDLQEKNSFVKWIVDQGYTVFMISWVNPGADLGHKEFADYMLEGPLEAIKAAQKITGEKQVNMVGYCLGGTLLAATMAYLAAKKMDVVKSITFLTTLIDFKESGDLAVFVDEEQLQLLEERMSATGYLSGAEMSTTFNMLRANDMIWSFYVNNYLMGKDPFPFDILYWNADSTRLPAAMHSFYLRNMYQNNLLKKPGGISLDGVPIDLSKINLPTYILAAKSDHIVPWKSAFSAMGIYAGDVRFALSDSGHVAGVVNHPSRQKYCYWINEKSEHDHKSLTPAKWFADASQYPGSWWSDWASWLRNHSGPMVPSKNIDSKNIIESAPGSYVKKKVVD